MPDIIFAFFVQEFGMYDLTGFAISVAAVDKQGNAESPGSPMLFATLV